jgi:hypothetical protein
MSLIDNEQIMTEAQLEHFASKSNWILVGHHFLIDDNQTILETSYTFITPIGTIFKAKIGTIADKKQCISFHVCSKTENVEEVEIVTGKNPSRRNRRNWKNIRLAYHCQSIS